MAVQHNKIFLNDSRVQRNKYTINLSDGVFRSTLGESVGTSSSHQLYISKFIKYEQGVIPSQDNLRLIDYEVYSWIDGSTYSFHSLENKQETYIIMVDKSKCSYVNQDLYCYILPAGEWLTITCSKDSDSAYFSLSSVSQYHEAMLLRHIEISSVEQELLDENLPWQQDSSYINEIIDEEDSNTFVNNILLNYYSSDQRSMRWKYGTTFWKPITFTSEGGQSCETTLLGYIDNDAGLYTPCLNGQRIINSETIDLTQEDIQKILDSITANSLNVKLSLQQITNDGSSTYTEGSIIENTDITIRNIRTFSQQRGTYSYSYTGGDVYYNDYDSSDAKSALFGVYGKYESDPNKYKWPFANSEKFTEDTFQQTPKALGHWDYETLSGQSSYNKTWQLAYNAPYEVDAASFYKYFWRCKDSSRPYSSGWWIVSTKATKIVVYDERDCNYGPFYLYTAGETAEGYLNDTNIFGGVSFKQECNTDRRMNPGTVATKTIEFDTYPDKFSSSDLGRTIIHNYSYDEDQGYKASGKYKITDISSKSSHRIHVIAEDAEKTLLDKQLGTNTTTTTYAYRRWRTGYQHGDTSQSIVITGAEIAQAQLYVYYIEPDVYVTQTRAHSLTSLNLLDNTIYLSTSVGDIANVRDINANFFHNKTVYLYYRGKLYANSAPLLYDEENNTVTFRNAYELKNAKVIEGKGFVIDAEYSEDFSSTKEEWEGFNEHLTGSNTTPTYYYHLKGTGVISTDFVDLQLNPSYKYSLAQLIEKINQYSGLTFENLPTTTYNLSIVNVSSLSYFRELIELIALTYGGYFICNNSKLIFKRFNQSSTELYNTDYLKFDKSKDKYKIDFITLNDKGIAVCNPGTIYKQLNINSLEFGDTEEDTLYANELCELIAEYFRQTNEKNPFSVTLAQDYDIQIGDIITIDNIPVVVTSKTMDSQKVVLESCDAGK